MIVQVEEYCGDHRRCQMGIRHSKSQARLIVGSTSAFLFACLVVSAASGQWRSIKNWASIKPQNDPEVEKWKREFRKVKTWYLSYTITIKGSVEGAGRGSKRSFSIDETITGNTDLNLGTFTSVPSTGAAKNHQEMVKAIENIDRVGIWRHIGDFKTQGAIYANLYPLHITIDDSFDQLTQNPGGEYGDCRRVELLWSWKTPDETDFAGSPFFEADMGALTYNITIPFKPEPGPNVVEYKHSQQASDCPNLYGRDEDPAPEDKKVSIEESLKLPLIKGLLDRGRIHHANPRPLNLTDTTWGFDSDDLNPGGLTPDQPLFQNWPETKEEVKVHVRYKLSRAPISGK